MSISKQKFQTVIIVLIITALVIIGYFVIESRIEKRKEIEANRPAELTAIKLVDNSCENCFDMSYLLTILKKQNVAFRSIDEVDIGSDKGQELISKYNITKVPILFIEGEIDKNQNFTKLWEGFGEKKEDILISDVFPPYKNLKTGDITGLVDMTIIYDKECKECYNTKVHTKLLEMEGITPVTTTKLDVNDEQAQELIDRYNITKIPTIILSSEAKYYKTFTTDWEQDGFVAFDGSYVFTAPEKIGTYKDLTTQEVITP